MTENTYTENIRIKTSMCDCSGKLGMAEAFYMYMDAACTHADILGVGLSEIAKKGLIWVAAKNMVVFRRRPAMETGAVLTTWPRTPVRYRSLRDYVLKDTSGEILSEGRTEWTVLDRGSGRLYLPEKLFGDDLKFRDDAAGVPEFSKMRYDDSLFEDAGTYIIRPTDCDVEGHMNNAAYVRAVCGCLPNEVWIHIPVREMEAHYLSQAFEGQPLHIMKAESGDDIVFSAHNDEGKAVFMLRVGREHRE